MQLDFAQKSNGLYVLSRLEIEQIATSVLNEYSPQSLETPIPLDTVDFLESYLGLIVKRRYIGTLESGILGLIVMSDSAEIPSLDDMYRQTVLEENFGTVLISPQLSGIENSLRRRYTEAHEGAHFLLHQPYYKNVCLRKGGRSANTSFIACRKVETYRESPKNDNEWIEWQADALAASLLMPQEIFTQRARSIIKKHGISCGYLKSDSDFDKRRAYDIIPEIAETFYVSNRAAQIRMLHLGLIRQVGVCL